MTDVGIVALQFTIAETVSRQANVAFSQALQVVEFVFEHHLADEVATTTAMAILEESMEMALKIDEFFRVKRE